MIVRQANYQLREARTAHTPWFDVQVCSAHVGLIIPSWWLLRMGVYMCREDSTGKCLGTAPMPAKGRRNVDFPHTT